MLTVLLFGWGLYEARNALIPVIRPDQAISSSWADLPITARNSGDVLAMHDAQFFCEATNITWKAEGQLAFRAVGPMTFMVSRPAVTIAPGTTVTFPCDLSNNATAKDITINGPPLPIALVHVRIKTTYFINLGLFRWHRKAESQVFTWRQVSGGFQWLEGDNSDAIK